MSFLLLLFVAMYNMVRAHTTLHFQFFLGISGRAEYRKQKNGWIP